MLDVASTSFIVNVPSLPKKEFEKYSTRLFDNWAEDVEKTLKIPDYSISLEVEEGSIKGVGKIAAALAAVYIGIGQYSDFISGLQTIRSQASYVNERLFENARSPFGGSNVNSQVRRNGGALGRLQTLFSKVQSRQLTVDEALVQAIILLGEEAEKNPEFIKDLQKQFENAPRHLEQLTFFEEMPEQLVAAPEDQKAPGKKRIPREIALPQKFRIEIWKDSKRDKRHVKVIDL